jgi:hypothetical protein
MPERFSFRRSALMMTVSIGPSEDASPGAALAASRLALGAALAAALAIWTANTVAAASKGLKTRGFMVSYLRSQTKRNADALGGTLPVRGTGVVARDA